MPPTPAPPTELETGHFVMVKELVWRSDLNHRAARVLSKSWTEAAQHPGRVPVEMVTVVKASPAKEDSRKVQIWVKLNNLEGPILDVGTMTAPPYTDMSPEERTEVGMRFAESLGLNEGTTLSAAKTLAQRPSLHADLVSAPPAPAPAPAPAPTPAPAPDRRAAARAVLEKMAADQCPGPHYCIFCGSEGPTGSKCVPCGFYRGIFCFPPGGALQKGDTYMGRKLAYVKWPWQGDPEAPYVRAEVSAPAPAPKPELSAFGNPKPERKGDPWGVAAFFEQLLKELPYYHREEMAEILKGETIKDLRVGEVIDGRNDYEKSLTVSLTKTPCEDSDDSDDESEGAEPTTRTITLNTYITPYDDNNAGVWLVDDTGYEHEMSSVGTIPCDGGEPVRSFNKVRAYRCAQYVIAYLVYGRLWWEEY